ncbi:MAG: hypothetical protein K0S44_2908 [Bacteroidetes bacterium]|jgi:hypothetical protein|nr:hypothetical protein [Bacteroidota bacterium]
MKKNIKSQLLNPFEFIAGGKALLIGIPVILLTGRLAYFSGMHFDGVIDMHIPLQSELYIHLLEGFIAWLSLAIVLALAGIILSSSRIRMIDIFGTLAFARWPMLLVALMGLLVNADGANKYIMYTFLKQGEAVVLENYELPVFILFIVITLLLSIWMIVLFYKAFTISCNLKGAKAIISFIIGLLLAEALSKLVLSFLY